MCHSMMDGANGDVAHALYHGPLLLGQDETMSEIDGATEASITEAIRELHGDKTLIAVAHRLATIRHCDRIYLVGDGRVVEEGSFEELKARSGRFRKLAGEQAARASART